MESKDFVLEMPFYGDEFLHFQVLGHGFTGFTSKSQHRRFRWQKAEEHEPRQNPRLRRWGLVPKMEEVWRIRFLEPVIFLVELNQWR